MRKNSLALAAVALIAFGDFAGSAAAADLTDTLNLEVEVINECNFTVQDFSGQVWGTSVESSSPHAGAISVTCNLGTPYSISLDSNGQNFGLGAGAGGDSRRSLADGAGEFLSYDIFQDEAMTIPWGEDAFAVTGVGTGSSIQHIYSLTFYYSNLVTDGFYYDDAPVTLTYN